MLQIESLTNNKKKVGKHDRITQNIRKTTLKTTSINASDDLLSQFAIEVNIVCLLVRDWPAFEVET